jgi:transposase
MMAQLARTYLVGIDVSKATLDVHEWWSTRGYTIDNTLEAIAEWLRGYEEVSLKIALEPTNRYHQCVAELADQAGHAVYCVDPYRLAHYREGVGQRAKVDRTDARLLARYLAHEGTHTRRWQALDGRAQRLWQLLKRRASLVKAKTQLQQSLGEVEVIQDPVAALMAQFTATIRHLERTLHAEAKQLGWGGALRRCQAIPGVGPLTAVALVAAYHRGAFRNVDAFIAYLGMDVRVRESGTFKGRRKLTKKGDPELRRLLYNAAMAARRNPLWEPYFLALTARGLSSTAAFVALGRKLARVCFALLKQQVEFDPKFCPGG